MKTIGSFLNILKKPTSALLVCAVFISAMILPPSVVEGAVTPAVTFIDNIKNTKSRDAILLQGETIKTDIVKPDNYILQSTQPFEMVSDTGTPVPIANYPFTMTPEGNITAKINTTIPMKQYTIRPIFSAFLKESDTGVANLFVQDPANPDDPTAPPLEKTVSISASVVGNTDVSITKTSTISFKVTADQTEENGHITFGTATATDDLAGDFNGALVSYQKREGANILIQISNPLGRKLDLSLNCPSMPSLIKANSKISLTFAMQTINTLQLTIISRQEAVNVIAGDIAATANFTDFVKLASGETWDKIKSKFSLVQKEQRYNNKKGFNISWDWKPNSGTDEHKKVLAITGSLTDAMNLATPRQILDDVPGNLVAKVTFTPDDGGATVEATKDGAPYSPLVPVTILGTGLMPSFVPLFEFTGKSDGSINQKDITVVPSNMDVNNGFAASMGPEFVPQHPFEFTAELKYGTGLGRAKNIKISFETVPNGEVDVFVDGSTTAYVPGTMLPLPADSSGEVTRSIRIRATKPGLVKMRIHYYNDSGSAYNNSPHTHNIQIVDTSPGKDPTFKFLKMTGIPAEKDDNGTPDESDDIDYPTRFNDIYPNGLIDFSYTPELESYDTISLPYAVKEIELTPTYNDIRLHNKNATYTVVWGTTRETKKSGEKTSPIPLSTEEPTIIYVNGTAQDGKELSSYRLTIKRNPRSSEASISDMTLKTEKDGKLHTFTPIFKPDQYNYTLNLPFHYANIRQLAGENAPTQLPGASALLTAVATGDWGAKPKFETTTNSIRDRGFFAKLFQNLNTAELNLHYLIDPATENVDNKNSIKISVQSEDRTKTAEYYLDIFIEDPSDNDKLSELKVSTQTKAGIVDLPYYQGKPFDKNQSEFYVDMKYLHDNVRFEFLPDDLKAQKVKISYPYTDAQLAENPALTNTEMVVDYRGTEALILRKFDAKNSDAAYANEFTFKFEVEAENGKWTANPYLVHFTRAEASKDSRLSDLKVTDAATGTACEEFTFIPTKTEYTFSVPFTTEVVSILPTANVPEFATISVDGKEVNAGRPTREISLNAGKNHKIEIIVTPESGADDATTYVLNITRTAPGTEARLIKLEVGGGEGMKPDPFVPSTLDYTVSIPKGTATFTITPTPYDKNATVTIDGKVAANGQAYGPITSVEAVVKYIIVVTAQDGKTQKKYTLTVTDYNLVNKSDNADLIDLDLNYADLKPRFQTGIDNYQIFLKPEAKKLELMPKVSPKATLEVFAGTKKLSPYSGKYATSVLGNKETITIRVTPESGNEDYIKTYTFTVLKNDKKEQGAFKPITADMVNYEEADPIVIDITNYAVIDASVFNKLKTDYPEKTIIFSGNDHMFRIKGKDIKELVPHTTQFDLAMNFTSPEQSMVSQLLMASGNQYDWSLEPVYLYFDDHGALPGQMLLTISLGREYQNSPLFWNYFNEERDRIDYYGYVNSNSKGTITVPVTHLSTYMVTPRPIYNSEDKTGMGFGWIQNATNGGSTLGGGSSNGNGNVTDGKDVPQTGVTE